MYRDATLNLQRTDTARQNSVDLDKILGLGPNLIGFQEIIPEHEHVVRDLRERGWEVWFPGGPADRVALAIDLDKFEVIDKGIEQTTDGKARVTPNRYLVWVLLRDRATGLLLARINTHAISGVESRGRPQDNPWRVRAHAEHLHALLRLIQKFEADGYLVVFGGDLNVNHFADKRVRYRNFPVALLGPHVTFDMPLDEGGTHGRRLIDYLGHVPDERISLVRSSIIEGLHSDHDGLIADYELNPEEADVDKFVSRSEWGANYPRPTRRIPGPVYGTTIHWEGPKMGEFPHSACARKVRSIERFHRIDKGWAGIAYTFLVCPHGYVYEGRGINRRTAANGTNYGNDHYYAICYLSGQGDAFTADAKRGILKAVSLCREGGAGQRVNCHRDHKATACPGDVITAWVRRTDFDDLRVAEPEPEEEPDMSWNQEIADWAPDSNRPGTKPAAQQLNQARGYAEDAYRNTNAILRLLAKDRIDLDALADKVAAKVNVEVTEAQTPADLDDLIKQSVKDALLEGAGE